jgi:neutral ceramidase
MNETGVTTTRRGFLGAASVLAAPLILRGSAVERRRLRAGAATSNITLPLGAANGGVIARGGLATNIHDDMHARCLALDDGRTRVAIAICDLRMIGREIVDDVKRRVHESTGLPQENVLIAATHTHGAPAAIGMHTADIDRRYRDFLTAGIADGVRRAVTNLAPARIGSAVGAVPEHVFNRRWFMREGSIPPDPFGGQTDRVRTNPPRASGDLLKPAGPVDPELTIVSVQHADGRPLALLANYGLHYVGGYERGHVSADYFAIFADRIQQLTGADRLDPPFVAMMSNGTSGDVNNIDFRKPRQSYESWTRMREVADDVADEAFRVYQQIEYHDDAPLAVRTTELQLGVRRPDPRRIEWARAILKEDTNPNRLTRPEIYASEALQLAGYPERVPVQLQAIGIGQLCIAAIPCEVFAETGLAIKEHRPLRPTFTIELANGYNGYLPTPEQHELGGYETWPARSSYLEVQAEAKILAAVLELLDQIDTG